MSQLTHGMNVEQVEELGRFLQARGQQVESMITAIDTKVRSSSWQGPDADRFRNDWWPRHKTKLHTTAQEIDGLGQSALNNAAAQRDVSTDTPGTTPGLAGAGGFSDDAAGVVHPHWPGLGDAWKMVHLVPIVGTLVTAGEVLSEAPRGIYANSVGIYDEIRYGQGDPRTVEMDRRAAESMHRFNHHLVDFGGSALLDAAALTGPGAVVRATEIAGVAESSSVFVDTTVGTTTSDYFSPSYWLNGVLP